MRKIVPAFGPGFTGLTGQVNVKAPRVKQDATTPTAAPGTRIVVAGTVTVAAGSVLNSVTVDVKVVLSWGASWRRSLEVEKVGIWG